LPLLTSEEATLIRANHPNESLVHELIHTTQNNDAQEWDPDWSEEEYILSEGTTQALTVRKINEEGEEFSGHYYQLWATAVDVMAEELAPEDPEQFLEDLSSVPAGQRRHWLGNQGMSKERLRDFFTRIQSVEI
jgi:hypothetical protein